ncbi:MAG: hypothetical protein M3P04_03485 [Actinomycetota bacterium]|nr:hypothetical protein [Actinomycetota bacterium]
MSSPVQRRAVSMWHVLWLLVFALDASLQGRGRAHQMGAVGLGLLFAFLVVTEVVATRRQR